MSWTCSICGLHIPGEVILPVHCICQRDKDTAEEVIRQQLLESLRLRWLELHRYPFTVAKWDAREAAEWLTTWQARIPSISCNCRQHWRELIVNLPPESYFVSREAFFAWTVEAHNRINSLPHLDKPRLTTQEARLLHDMRHALAQPESLLTPRSNVAIVSIASGHHLATLEQTRPLRAEYASRIGADMVELTDDRWPEFPMANKWRLTNVFEAGYERLLYVDSDVILKADAPDIFQVVPEEAIGLVDELPTIRANGIVQVNYENEFACVAEEYGWTKPDWCPNGGVMVLPRKWASVYEPPLFISSNRWCIDQYLLAIECERRSAPVHLLDEKWNWGWIDKRFWDGISGAYFVHMNGSGSGEYRQSLIDRAISGNYQPLRHPRECGLLT